MLDKPHGVVLVTEDLWRIGVDLKPVDGEHLVWIPLIEASFERIMPQVIAIDAEYWPESAHLRIPAGPGYDTRQWAERIIRNSPINLGYLHSGIVS